MRLHTLSPLLLTALLVACTGSSIGNSVRTGPTDSSLTSVDDTWNLYENRTLGFSLRIPKELALGTSGTFVPMKVLEVPGQAEIYIAPSLSPKINSNAKLVPTTIALLQDHTAQYAPPLWDIRVATVSSDAELDLFIKQTFGAACGIDLKRPSSQPEVFDVQLSNASGDTSPDVIQCEALMGNPAIKYAPERHRVAYWYLTQGVQFVGDAQGSMLYDPDMLASFRFE